MGIRITIVRENRPATPRWRRVTERTVVTALSATTLMLAAGGIAIASIPDNQKIFHGCYSTSTGALRLIDSAKTTTCNTGEAAVTWDQQGMNWRGTWKSTTQYQIHDAVVYSGTSYIALAANIGAIPSANPTYWSVLAQAGSPGQRGSQWYTGTGAPTTITGQADGDNYLNKSTGDVYQLETGTWTKTGNIKGPAGAVNDIYAPFNDNVSITDAYWTVEATTGALAAGNYVVNSVTQVIVASGDQVECQVITSPGDGLGQPAFSTANYAESISTLDKLAVSAGEALELTCLDVEGATSAVNSASLNAQKVS